MTLVITSTTSSKEEMEHAAGENWRTPPEVPAAQEEESPAETDQELAETAADQESAENQESDKSERPKRKGGYQRTIEKQNRRIQELESQLAGRDKPAETAGAPPANGEPKWQDYQTLGKSMEDFLKDRDAWKDNQAQVQAITERRESLVKDYNQSMIALENENDDVEETFASQSNLLFSRDMAEALYQLGGDGPLVTYRLAKEPDLVESIREMTPHQQVMAIKEFALATKKEAKTSSPKAATKATPPPPIRRTAGSAASTTTIPMDKLSPKEYIKARNQQIRDRAS